MANKRRTYRVAERIREVVAQELLRLADPRLELVTITNVMTSPDLRHAKVYWMASGDKKRIPDVEAALKNTQGLFRRLLAKDLGVRFVPELRFYYDDTIDTVNEVDQLFARLHSVEEKQEESK